MRYVALALLVALTAACRMPEGDFDKIPVGRRVGNNNHTGTLVKFIDAEENVVCYATGHGLSCLKRKE